MESKQIKRYSIPQYKLKQQEVLSTCLQGWPKSLALKTPNAG
jgi:hypothetical protein